MKLNNKYYIMRHGQALSNEREVCSCWPEKFHNPLTKLGKQKVKEAVEKLLDKNIDLIFASPLLRAKMSSEIAAKILKLKPIIDKRLREIGFGRFNNKPIQGMWKSFKKEEDRISKGVAGGESYEEILERMMDFLKDINKKYKGKNILIISHEGPLVFLQGKTMGLTIKGTIKKFPLEKRIHKGEVRELN